MKSNLFLSRAFNQANDNSQLSFVNKCLYSDNKKISDASNAAMLIIKNAIYEDIECDPERLHFEIERIKQGLSFSESIIIERFILECASELKAQSENSIKRQLKKKGND